MPALQERIAAILTVADWLIGQAYVHRLQTVMALGFGGLLLWLSLQRLRPGSTRKEHPFVLRDARGTVISGACLLGLVSGALLLAVGIDRSPEWHDAPFGIQVVACTGPFFAAANGAILLSGLFMKRLGSGCCARSIAVFGGTALFALELVTL